MTAGRRIAVLLKGYPRLSETFIAQELLALEKAGLKLAIVSLRKPYDPAVHPIHREIAAEILYLPEYLYQEPWRVLKGLAYALGRQSIWRALGVFLRDLVRDPTPNRLRRFGQACVLLRELPEGTEWLYAHFLHTPGSVARYVALLSGLPWSVSAHARDIWTIPDWEKREKLEEMAWLVTCTRYGADHLRGLTDHPEKVRLVYHGLDFSRLPPAPPARAAKDGLDPAAPVVLLSVGRAVEKKGYDDLLNALARLPEKLNWRLIHIGGGELAKALKAKAGELGVDGRVDWRGAQPQEEVFKAYAEADLFVLASRIAKDGDRDGLPNVLMEAQAQGLACLTTDVSAIPELIEDRVTGWLVAPENPEALAEALETLIADPALRARLAEAGAARVREAFSFEAGVETLKELLPRTGPAG
jgi:glycosyltransferase involved in cell wall biosynthesis